MVGRRQAAEPAQQLADEPGVRGRVVSDRHVGMSLRILKGRSMKRAADRVASVMSRRPARRRAPIARFLRAAMFCGPDWL